jgi:hypothetical protein
MRALVGFTKLVVEARVCAVATVTIVVVIVRRAGRCRWMKSGRAAERTAITVVVRTTMSTGGAATDKLGDAQLPISGGRSRWCERPPTSSHAHGFVGFFHVLDASVRIVFLHGGLRLIEMHLR